MTSLGFIKTTCRISAKFGTPNEQSLLLEGRQETIRHERLWKGRTDGQGRTVRYDGILKMTMKFLEGIVKTAAKGHKEVAIGKVNTGESKNMKMTVPPRNISRN